MSGAISTRTLALILTSLASLALVLAPTAEAKGLESFSVCGNDGCRAVERFERAARVGFALLESVWEGQPARAPAVAPEWYRVDLEWMHGINEPSAFEELIVPASLDRIGFRQRGEAEWVSLHGPGRERYVRLVDGLVPLPADSFPSRLGVKVAATEKAGNDHRLEAGWLALGAALALGLSFGLWRRSRRGS